MLVAARTTTSAPTPDGITIFARRHAAPPGLAVEPNVGWTTTSKASTLTLDDVRVAGDAVVGQVDGGWPILETDAAAGGGRRRRR